MTYGLLAACADDSTVARALEIVEELPDVRSGLACRCVKCRRWPWSS